MTEFEKTIGSISLIIGMFILFLYTFIALDFGDYSLLMVILGLYLLKGEKK